MKLDQFVLDQFLQVRPRQQTASPQNQMKRKRARHQQPARSAVPPADRFDRPAIAIFVIALVVRMIHISQIREAPFFTVLMGDSRAYDDWAQRIAQGDWLGQEVFYQAPLYPYFLGALYAIAGRDLFVVRVCQAIVGSVACVLLGVAGWRVFSKPVGVIAGLTLALYAPAIFFDGLLQKSVLDVFFLCLAIWLLSGLFAEPQARRHWLWLGLAVGGLSLTRENALVFIAVILLWAFARRGVPGKERVATAGVFLLGLTVVLLPVAARNNAVGGGFYLTTSQFGPNLYIGNNARADGTYMSLRFGRGAPEYERQDATELAEQAMGRHLTPAEVSSYWTGRALAFIRSQPVAWLKLLLRKLALLFNATEMLDTESQEIYADWSTPVRLAGRVGHFGVLVPLAFLGVVVTWPLRGRLWVLYGMSMAYAASVGMFYVFARYRYPLVPFLVLFASAGLVGMRRLSHGRSARDLAGGGAAIAAVAVFCNLPLLSTDLMRAITETNLGTALHEDGRLREAITHYRRAIAIRSDYPPAHNNLGVSLRAQGNVGEAIERYEHALGLRADYPAARANLANALRARGNEHASRGELADGLADLRRAVELRPEEGEARYDLATALLEASRFAEATEELRQALRLMPNSVEAHNNLGIALASQGKLDEAIAMFRQALRLQPDFTDAQRNLAMALKARGRN